MQIQVRTDHNIQGDERLAEYVEDVLTDSLSRFSNDITRIEVHFADENGDKSGEQDTRCTLEARVRGRKPTVVTAHAANVKDSLGSAADKLASAIEKELGRARRVR
ncbi:MAG: hypothetical protein CMN30_24060 [Sandaracinus sp.]|nr:hypothetical protein [Sandaracinus sp.]|tara:strand:- start:4946 stop:5263 length:318 start_codon:yes stop_codon:yes gene_type:complete